MKVRTNDPNRQLLILTMTGMVEKFVDINPDTIRLIGPAETPLVAEVVITPQPKYPFTIREIKAKKGNAIEYKLKERCKDDPKRCVIRVENKQKGKGRYFDTLTVVTDSPVRPEFTIRVFGDIR